MDICFVVTQPSRGSPGTFERIHSIVKHLRIFRIGARVLTPFPEDITNYPDIRVESIPTSLSRIGMESLAYSIGRMLHSYKPSSNLFLSHKSIMTQIEMITKGIENKITNTNTDIIHTVQPWASLACSRLAQDRGIPLISDLHNIWSEEAVSRGQVTRNDPSFLRLHGYEQQVIDSSDSLTVVSEEMRSYITDNYIVEKKPVIVLPPGGTLRQVTDSLERKKNVVYAGLVNKIEHVDLFANSIPYVRKNANFFISKNGDALRSVQKITKSDRFPVINYIWFRKYDELIRLLQSSRIGIVTSQVSTSRRIGPPLKLFEYLSCALPVVGNKIGGWSDMIEKEHVGITTKEDPHCLAEAIDEILGNDSKFEAMSKNAVRTIKNKYNWNIHVREILIPLYNKLLE